MTDDTARAKAAFANLTVQQIVPFLRSIIASGERLHSRDVDIIEGLLAARPSGLLREAALEPLKGWMAEQDWLPTSAVESILIFARAALAATEPGLDDDAYFARHGHEPYCPADYIIPEGPCDCRAARSRP